MGGSFGGGAAGDASIKSAPGEIDRIVFLDELAQYIDRDRSYLIKEAIDEYIEYHRWQIEETRKAITEADAGDFATGEEVDAYLREERDSWE